MGVRVYPTGGETADVGDLVRTIIVDSTVTCRMRRADVIDNAHIQANDVIVGLSSSGQATYEKEYNGGMGSNGLTSARHDLFAHYLAKKYPESYDPSIPAHLVYSGNLKLTETTESLGVDAGKLVLSPTRTYAPIISLILKELREKLTGWFTLSGKGAKPRCYFLKDGLRAVKNNLFPTLRSFNLSRSSRKPTGKRCTGYSTWGTVWSCTCPRLMPSRSSISLVRLTWMRKSWDTLKSRTKKRCV